jgi:hypothetical protein
MRADDKRCPAAAAFVGRMPPMMRGQDRAGRATVPTRVRRAARITLKERGPRPLRSRRAYENGPGRTDALHSNSPSYERTRCRPARAAIMYDWLPLEPTRWKRKLGKKGYPHPGRMGERRQRTRHGRQGPSTVSRGPSGRLRPGRCGPVGVVLRAGRLSGPPQSRRPRPVHPPRSPHQPDLPPLLPPRRRRTVARRGSLHGRWSGESRRPRTRKRRHRRRAPLFHSPLLSINEGIPPARRQE